SHASRQRRLSSCRRPHRQRAWHHRRLHAPHPPLAAHEQIPRHRPPRRLLHLYRVQRRRLPHPRRRPPPLPRLPHGRPLLVDRAPLPPHVVHRRRPPPLHVFYC